MRISAAGSKGRQAGVTLIELMVVLVVLSVLTAVTTMALPPRVTDAERAAGDLAATIAGLSDQAIVESRPLGLDMSVTGWRVVSFREGRWEPTGTAAPTGAQLGYSVEAADDFALPEEAEEGEILIRRRGATAETETVPAPAPAIVFDPVGEATAATITITGEGARYAVTIGPFGEVEVARAED
jgi:type II secretion system protein H